MKSVFGIWYDVGTNRERCLDNWYLRREVPDALGSAGLLSIRRYVALSDGPRFLTLYEYDSGGAVQPEVVLQRLVSATDPSTRRACRAQPVSALGGAQQLCLGSGVGGVAMTLRIRLPDLKDLDGLSHILEEQVLPLPGILGTRIWHDVDKEPEAAVLVEGTTPGALAAALNCCATDPSSQMQAESTARTAYRLLHIADTSTRRISTPGY